MASGTEIVCQADPKGTFLEGIVSGTPKPGTWMEIVPGVAPVNGRYTWRARTAQHGVKRLNVILREDHLQGKTASDAYVSGTRCFLYVPQEGEELNALIQYQAGTGTSADDDIGERLEINYGGMLQGVVTSTNDAPCILLENIDTAFTSDYLALVMYVG